MLIGLCIIHRLTALLRATGSHQRALRSAPLTARANRALRSAGTSWELPTRPDGDRLVGHVRPLALRWEIVEFILHLCGKLLLSLYDNYRIEGIFHHPNFHNTACLMTLIFLFIGRKLTFAVYTPINSS